MIPPKRHSRGFDLSGARLSASPSWFGCSTRREARGSAYARSGPAKNLGQSRALCPTLAHGLPLENNVILVGHFRCGGCGCGFLGWGRQEFDVRGPDFQVDAGCAFSIGPLIQGQRTFEPNVAALGQVLVGNLGTASEKCNLKPCGGFLKLPRLVLAPLGRGD